MRTLLSKSPSERRAFCPQPYDLMPNLLNSVLPLPREAECKSYRSPAGRENVRGLIINPTTLMAWRPYENLINGELDNRIPGKVTGWIRFFRGAKRPLQVRFDLAGD